MSKNVEVMGAIVEATFEKIPKSLLNKTFYRFLFGFLAIVASTLMIIVIAGVYQGT